MHRVALALALVILLVGLAPVSLAPAQLGPNAPAPLTEEPAPPPSAPNEFDDDGLSTLQKLLIFGGAGLVLAAIAFVIVRDARRAAPPDGRPRGSSSGDSHVATGTARTARERERQQRAKRAKAKAARQQRKRNRQH